MQPQDTPNAEHITCWNQILVPKFTRFRDVFVQGAEVHSNAALERHPAKPGDRVIDVGCGFGETSIELARRVAPGGFVLGVDCCQEFLDVGASDAARAGVGNVRFESSDAQVHRFSPDHDLVFSRFGTMFFASPVAALRNLRAALRSGGRLLMIVWRPVETNPWVGIPKQVVQELLPPPPEKGPTCGPGPFSMSDPGSVREMLAAAGLVDPTFDATDATILIGRTVREAVELQLTLGPAGELMREGGDEAERRRPQIEAALEARMREHLGSDGVYLPSSSWCVTARAP
jgi:ubiquinone/menaquinone biosynthesis C-methylase UbiE